jgi:cyclic pyranopterin phosphate synthase
MAQSALLSFEEIERISRLMLPLGVKKLRLTGGEPLMRKQLDRLIAALAALRTPQGAPVDLAMTTNASLLAQHAASLKQAGLQRLTISLDALDDAIFQRMNDAQVNVAQVLGGIEAAQKAGFEHIKVNMVVQRGVNDKQIIPMAQHFRHSGIELRFIEFMDVGTTNGWQSGDVFSAQAIQAQLQAHYPLQALPPRHVSDTAMRYAYADGAGTVGFIASVTQAFCGHCNRLRLSTDGQLFTCLFATQGTDLKEALRSGMPDAELQARLAKLWSSRQDRYSELREQHRATAGTPHAPARVEMSYIGG